MEDFNRIYFDGSNCRLSAIDFGNPEKPDLVILHGMRDHALSMVGMVQALSDDYHVVVPDLRGHGYSENPGNYGIIPFVADLAALISHFDLNRPVLIGHSLGGHIATKYSAIYGDQIECLALLDGMGPPDNTVPRREDLLARLKGEVESALVVNEPRPMQDSSEALERLTRNNPALSVDLARIIVEHGIEPGENGGVVWRWDPRVQTVFSTISKQESETLWTCIECPVLMVTGEDSWQYWTRGDRFKTDVDHHDTEMERRVNLFKNARHKVLKGAGHMLHYDQPDELNTILREFLGL